MTMPVFPRRVGLPLAMQMIAILVCALLAAQVVTLLLTVILPPAPTARWNIDEVAAALRPGGSGGSDRLERRTMPGPPDVSGQGWLVSESSRAALAQRIGREPRDVVLAFYTQLPVGGVAVPAGRRSPLAVATAHPFKVQSLLLGTAEAQSIPGGPPRGGAGPTGMPGGGSFPGGMPPGGFPRGMPAGGSMPRGANMPGGALPRATMPGAPQGRAMQSPGQNAATMSRSPTPMQQDSFSGTVAAPGTTGFGGGNTANGAAGSTGAGFSGGMGNGPSGTPGAGSARPGDMMRGSFAAPGSAGLSPGVANLPVISDLPIRRGETSAKTQQQAAAPAALPLVPPVPAAASAPGAALPAADMHFAQPPVAITPQAAQAMLSPQPVGTPQPIPFRRTQGSVFELASPPFIEGDFVAAARQPDGSWLAVAPRAEPFPNAWQKRVILWFALSLAVISPLAWLFVRRIVLPLRDFARAAEQLGRDPSATILPLSGPAEIGRAANAFNQMRNRLRAFVDDRTAMVGAISHDLRTPLTRLRFRLEDVPDKQREGLLREVTEMEAMISEVITFIRDASTPDPRQRLDFAELVQGSVADAKLVGADVEIEHNMHIPVEVDPVGIRRLLGNLLENAVKYGQRARVRVSLADGEAVAEIVDAGPGMPEEEFERAFEPFYRSEAARTSGRSGSGLGLTVCRSIARAHGGDVTFAHGREGFIARVRVPAAYSSKALRAA